MTRQDGRNRPKPCAEAPANRPGASCSFVNPTDGPTAHCYRCGRTLIVGEPFDVGSAHVIADIRGTGLRSVR